MSQQLRVFGFNNRLIGNQYIGNHEVTFETQFLYQKPVQAVTQYERPSLTYVPDPDTESIETRSIGSDESLERVTPLEYRIAGITWWTPQYVNSCNLDSFLSAWVRKIRQTHGKFLKHLVSMDYIGVVLFKIADHTLCAKESVDSNMVKGMWITAVLRNSGETSMLSNPPINCYGVNLFSIFQHLYFHSAFEIVSMCLCGTFYHYDFVLTVPTLLQLTYLGDPQKLHSANMPRCLNCNTQRILQKLNPINTSWMVVFSYRGDPENRSPLLEDIPQFITLANVQFKLEYISYSQNTSTPNVHHEVSLQFIRRQWYIFDSARSPRFRWWGGKRYTYQNAQLITIVYFRL